MLKSLRSTPHGQVLDFEGTLRVADLQDKWRSTTIGSRTERSARMFGVWGGWGGCGASERLRLLVELHSRSLLLEGPLVFLHGFAGGRTSLQGTKQGQD